MPFEFGQKSASDESEISRVDLESGSVAFKVTDKKNGATIFNTQVGPIIFEEMFMQVRFCIYSKNRSLYVPSLILIILGFYSSPGRLHTLWFWRKTYP